MQNETTAETTMANCSNDEGKVKDEDNDEGDFMIGVAKSAQAVLSGTFCFMSS